MDSFKKLLDLMAEVLSRSTAPILDRIDVLEKRQPERGEKGEPGTKGLDGEKGAAGERGEPGIAGKDGRDAVDGKDGAPGRDGESGQRGVDGAAGKDGAPGRDGVDGKDGLAGAAGVDGKAGLPGERGADGKDGAAGLNGKEGAPGRDGVDGIHGKDGGAGKDGAPGVDGKEGVAGRAGVDGMHGKDGRDGVDGKSLTVEDVTDWLDAHFSKWALDAERRVYELGEKAVAAMPRPKDGADGLRVDDFELVGRMLTLKHGANPLKTVRIGFPIYKGVYEQDESYEPDDMVTFGGSVWVAGAETKSKPGTDDTWKLAVKKGRDGRDAKAAA